MFDVAIWLSVVTAETVCMTSSFSAVRSTVRVSILNCSATARPSVMSSPKLRLEAHGIMMPTVLSHAALQRMPTSALSLPPLLP